MRTWVLPLLGVALLGGCSTTEKKDAAVSRDAGGDGPRVDGQGGLDKRVFTDGPRADGSADKRVADKSTSDGPKKDAAAADKGKVDGGGGAHIVWAQQSLQEIGDPSKDELWVAPRSAGGFYVGGAFVNQLTYGGKMLQTQPRMPITQPPQDTEGLVGAVDSSGNPTWLTRIGGDPWGARVLAIAGSGKGAHVVGRFNGPVDFDATTKLTSSVKSAGPPATYHDEGFFARYEDNGTFVCAVHFKGNGVSTTAATGVAADAAGNAYVVGMFTKSLTLDGTTTLTAPSIAVFVASYDSLCKLRWSSRIEGGSTTSRVMALGSNGRLYLHLDIAASTDFYDSANVISKLNLISGTSALIAYQAATGRFATSSNCVPCKGPSDCLDPGAVCGPAGYCSNNAGSMTACFIESTCRTCPGDPCPTPGSTCKGNQCMLDSDPTKCVHLHSGSGAQPVLRLAVNAWNATDMAVDAQNNVYIVGTFKNALQFINGNAAKPDGGKVGSMFVLALDDYLSTRWVNVIGHATGEVRAAGVAVDGQGRAVVKGYATVGVDIWSKTLNTNGSTSPISTAAIATAGPFYAAIATDGASVAWSETSKGTVIEKSTYRSANLVFDGTAFFTGARFHAASAVTYGPSTLAHPPTGGSTLRFYLSRINP